MLGNSRLGLARSPLHTADVPAAALQQPPDDAQTNRVGQRLEQDAERASLRRSVEQLSPRERQIMELRFGLLDGVERTQKEVADAIGISQSYISRLEKRIIRQLREQLGE